MIQYLNHQLKQWHPFRYRCTFALGTTMAWLAPTLGLRVLI
ncbi:Hypothetical protein I595_3124 [Croceitalea dokdonensis DOKDO 023]|uniref:Uncharacterized protein n=1 Tax=Croceitalea dokdonensis DOKDO 023 TaxID=1300341 RepID=A0A0P7AS15_9FLAO|nr:Hypothetical protein I595_3124 [Croceitalea dokdonensis DOKDO 023]